MHCLGGCVGEHETKADADHSDSCTSEYIRAVLAKLGDEDSGNVGRDKDTRLKGDHCESSSSSCLMFNNLARIHKLLANYLFERRQIDVEVKLVYLKVNRKVEDQGPKSHAHEYVDREQSHHVAILPKIRRYDWVLGVFSFHIQESTYGRHS